MYNLRDQILESKDLYGILNKYVSSTIDLYIKNNVETKNQNKYTQVMDFFDKELQLVDINLDETYINSIENETELKEVLVSKVNDLITDKKEGLGEEISERILNNILLSSIDRNWPGQITKMDYLKTGVHYRQYEGKNPITVYKNEAYKLFDDMFLNISKQSLLSYLHVVVQKTEQIAEEEKEENNE